MGTLARELARNPLNLLCLAEQAVTSAEPDAKWQLAAELGRVEMRLPEVEPLLLRFASDEDEYVRRRSLTALADVGSTHVSELAERAWHSGDEYQRMAALYALLRSGSPELSEYLARAEADGRPNLVDYAARIRAGKA